MSSKILLLAACALSLFAAPRFLAAADPVLSPEDLGKLGHRNFIVIADMAYPWQSAPGITTRYVGGDHLDLVARVLGAVEAAPHVNPVIYIDAEMAAVPESAAPGITAFRKDLDALLEGRPAQRLPHMDIIRKLDASSELFHVLILKSDLTLPYTSVFIELDCGYWDGEREAALRKQLGE